MMREAELNTRSKNSSEQRRKPKKCLQAQLKPGEQKEPWEEERKTIGTKKKEERRLLQTSQKLNQRRDLAVLSVTYLDLAVAVYTPAVFVFFWRCGQGWEQQPKRSSSLEIPVAFGDLLEVLENRKHTCPTTLRDLDSNRKQNAHTQTDPWQDSA